MESFQSMCSQPCPSCPCCQFMGAWKVPFPLHRPHRVQRRSLVGCKAWSSLAFREIPMWPWTSHPRPGLCIVTQRKHVPPWLGESLQVPVCICVGAQHSQYSCYLSDNL